MGFWSALFFSAKIIGITLGGMFVVGVLLATTFTWLNGKEYGCVFMKFKQWRELYELNPVAWNVKGDNPSRLFCEDGRRKNIFVQFSFIDTIRFLAWQSRAEKRKKQVLDNEKLRLLLRAAQTDIEKLRAQADREMEEAKNQVEQVRVQLEKER